MSKLSNIVKNEIVKKTVYYKLATKVNNIDVTNPVKKPDNNTKLSEIEGKIPSIAGLVTTSALTAVENKIP